MNFGDLQEDVWRFIGVNDSTLRHDYLTQQVRDDINRAIDDIYMSASYLWHMVKEGTIDVVSGTSTYALNDYCIKPLGFWTADTYAHKIGFLSPRDSDRNGLRNSTLTGVEVGPWHLTWAPYASAYKSGTSADGLVLTEGGVAVTKSGGTAWSSTDVGRIIKFNGADDDYKIASYVSANSITIDKPYRSRLVGVGTSGVGTVPVAPRWEVTPAGTYQVQFLPTPGSSKTVYYRYVARARRLISDDDTPELPGQYHHLISFGAILRTTRYLEDPQSYGSYRDGLASGMERLVQEDRMEMDEEYQSIYDSPIRRSSFRSFLPQDIYQR
jgi:hypothetical protein